MEKKEKCIFHFLPFIRFLFNIANHHSRQYLQKVFSDMNIPCYAPANGVSVTIDATHSIPVSVSRNLLKRQMSTIIDEDNVHKKQKISSSDKLIVQGLLVCKSDSLCLLEPSEAITELGLTEHTLSFESKQKLLHQDGSPTTTSPETIIESIYDDLNRFFFFSASLMGFAKD